jgi:hypothetical protein
MTSPLETPLASLNPAELADKIPTFELTSLNALLAYYGAVELASKGIKPTTDEAFLTPDRLQGLDTEEWIIVSVDIDLRDPTNPQLEGIEKHALTEERISDLGLSRYSSGKRDHSVTNVGKKSGTNTLEDVQGYCVGRVAKWPDREPIQSVADEHPDGRLITAISTLGDDDDIQEQLKNAVEDQCEGSSKVISTVRLRLDTAALAEPPADEPSGERYWPGEVPVFVAAAAERNRTKLAGKNVSDGDGVSKGDGTCSVTGEKTEVVGAVEGPLGVYALQHTDEMFGFHDDSSWRQNPLSARTGVLMSQSDSLVDSCYWSVGGIRVYALPYFTGEQIVEKAVFTHELLNRIRDDRWDEQADGDNQVLQVQRFIEQNRPELLDALRFYFITLRTDSAGVRVFFEEPAVTTLSVLSVARTHERVVTHLFGGHFGLTARENWSLIDPSATARQLAGLMLNRRYVIETLLEPYPNAGDYKDAATDPRESVTYAVLTGGMIDPEWLLSQYMRRVKYDRRENEVDNSNTQQKVKQQFTQLQTFAGAGILSTPQHDPELAAPPTYMTPQDSASQEYRQPATDGGTGASGYVEMLSTQLTEFIESHPVLDEDTERKGAFLTGVFVSMVSKHQREKRKISRTFMDRYDVGEITPSQLMQMLPKVIAKDGVYAREADGLGATVAPGVRNRLPEELATDEPTDWDISPVQFRYFYALGTAYGEDASYAASAAMNESNGNESEATQN